MPESKEPERALRPGRYRHFKGGEYEVLGVARHSEGLEDMVVDAVTGSYESLARVQGGGVGAHRHR